MATNNLTLQKLYKETYVGMLEEIKPWLENYDSLTFSQKREFDRRLTITKSIKEISDKLADDVDFNIKEYLRDVGDKTYIDLIGNLKMDNTAIDADLLEQIMNKPIAGANLSQRLYKQRDKFAKRVTSEIRTGLVMGKSYDQIAGRIKNLTDASFNNAMRIVRTESSRISSEVAQKGYQDAKKLGINIKKKWVSGHDSRTRDSHAKLDGQIVDIEDEFEVNGRKALAPSLFGIPSEDINCRCTTVEVLVDDDEETADKKSEKELFNESISSKLTDDQIDEYNNMLKDAPDDVRKLYDKHKSNLLLSDVSATDGAWFDRDSKMVSMNIVDDLKGDVLHAKGSTFFHEFAHNIDYLTGNTSQKFGYNGIATSLREVMDGEWMSLSSAESKVLKKEFKEMGAEAFFKSKGTSHFIFKSGTAKTLNKADAEWLILDRMKKELTPLERADISDWLEYSTKKSYPLGAGHKWEYHHKHGDMTSKEIFAEITSAYITNPSAIKTMEKLFPDTMKAYEVLLKGLI